MEFESPQMGRRRMRRVNTAPACAPFGAFVRRGAFHGVNPNGTWLRCVIETARSIGERPEGPGQEQPRAQRGHERRPGIAIPSSLHPEGVGKRLSRPFRPPLYFVRFPGRRSPRRRGILFGLGCSCPGPSGRREALACAASRLPHFAGRFHRIRR